MSDKFDVDALIGERQTTHGDYLLNSRITWQIKESLHQGVHYHRMHPAMKETLDMVAHKMHRIVNGDPFFKDHWVDMTGYPHLVVGQWDRILEDSSRSTGVTRFTGRMVELSEDELATVIALREGRASVMMLTISQRRMAADMAAARRRAAPREGLLEPLESPVEPAEAPPATPTEAPAPTAPGTPEDGGHHEMTFRPSHIRQPICATSAEYEEIRGQKIRSGSMIGSEWSEIYLTFPNADGRWDMSPFHTGEYGK